jgi:hypothetical protein
MTLNYAERFMSMQALIVRRVPANSRITPKLLVEALQADNELVREKRPDLYYDDGLMDIAGEVNICVEQGLIEDGNGRKIGRYNQAITLRRTELGEMFLNSLEPRFAEALDDMPMSDVGVLDFLSLI